MSVLVPEVVRNKALAAGATAWLDELPSLIADLERDWASPDGLLAEAEYDLGILMREDPVELRDGDPWARARWLARRCRLDATADYVSALPPAPG